MFKHPQNWSYTTLGKNEMLKSLTARKIGGIFFFLEFFFRNKNRFIGRSFTRRIHFWRKIIFSKIWSYTTLILSATYTELLIIHYLQYNEENVDDWNTAKDDIGKHGLRTMNTRIRLLPRGRLCWCRV